MQPRHTSVSLCLSAALALPMRWPGFVDWLGRWLLESWRPHSTATATDGRTVSSARSRTPSLAHQVGSMSRGLRVPFHLSPAAQGVRSVANDRNGPVCASESSRKINPSPRTAAALSYVCPMLRCLRKVDHGRRGIIYYSSTAADTHTHAHTHERAFRKCAICRELIYRWRHDLEKMRPTLMVDRVKGCERARAPSCVCV